VWGACGKNTQDFAIALVQGKSQARPFQATATDPKTEILLKKKQFQTEPMEVITGRKRWSYL
jgi:hypothetical protein